MIVLNSQLLPVLWRFYPLNRQNDILNCQYVCFTFFVFCTYSTSRLTLMVISLSLLLSELLSTIITISLSPLLPQLVFILVCLSNLFWLYGDASLCCQMSVPFISLSLTNFCTELYFFHPHLLLLFFLCVFVLVLVAFLLFFWTLFCVWICLLFCTAHYNRVSSSLFFHVNHHDNHFLVLIITAR